MGDGPAVADAVSHATWPDAVIACALILAAAAVWIAWMFLRKDR